MKGEIFTPLGSLKIKDIFFYYDGPRIFSCTNNSTTFLAFLVDEFEERDFWFFVPISTIREFQIKKGKISIREAIIKAEDPIYQIYLPVSDNAPASFSLINGDKVPFEYLPADDSFIVENEEIASSELPPKPSKALDEAVLSRRDVLDIAIERVEDKNELPSLQMGKLLTNTQNTLYGLDERWDQNQNKPPTSVVEDNNVNVTMLFASSFGIRIKSNKSSNLFDVTPASNSLRVFAELLEHSKNEEELKQHLKRINPKAVTLYKEFLSSFESDSSKLKVEWASPNNETRYTVLTSDELNKAKEIISISTETMSETITETKIKGELIAINLKRNTFYIEGDDGTPYSGALSKEIAEYVHKGYKFEVPKDIIALIEIKQLINEITKKETLQLKLKEVYEE
ncbi:hypothetical protein DRW41_05435 [Neobacillus piezotolerans]|uniref:DUF6575 domain-containing protein n=1 Tax=Neobacillus piezotolerans TaxID=2259171 RepID=A0A3D8GTB0_9BACI|nr:DUF6575 domain-containing protein [Neobacillus piezotolerans]RDU37296.1 hypothetical protein DRW41_05435 [Neobacillus piezotolerans]